jgi:membrane glycosyltransferase
MRAFVSMIAEVVISGLIAPVMMLIQSSSVAGILMGRDSGWNVQRRDDGSLPLRDVARRYGWHTAFGLLLALAAYGVSFSLFAWMTQVIAGLLLAIPLAQWSASPAAGRALRRMKLLLVPEENRPPDILLRANALVETFAAGSEANGAFATLFSDPALVTAHRALLGAPAERKRGEIDAALVIGLAKLDDCVSLSEADAMLSGREKMAVLNDPRGLDRLAELAKRRG